MKRFFSINRDFYSKPFVGLLAANMFFWMSVNLFLPVLPIYYHRLGLNDHEVGTAIGAYSIGALLFRVIGGKAVDKYGSRPVIAAGIALSILAIGSYCAADTLLGATAARLMHGIGISGYSAAALTMTALLHEDKNITEAVAVYTLSTMIGIGVAASSAGWIFNHTNFVTIVGLGILATGLSLLFFPKTPGAKKKPTEGAAPPFLQVIVRPGILIPTLCLLGANLCYAAVMTFLPLFMVSNGIQQFSLFYITYSVTVVLSRVWVGKLCAVFTPEKLAFFVLVVLACSLFVISLGGYWWILAVGGAGIGIGYGLAFPALATIVSRSVSIESRGTAFGFFTMAVDAGFAIGAIGLGFVADGYGYSTVFLAAGAYTVLFALMYIWELVPKIRLAVSEQSGQG